MNNFHQVLGKAVSDIRQQVSQDVIKRLEEVTEKGKRVVEREYGQFFNELSYLIGEADKGSGVANESGGLPAGLQGFGRVNDWKPLSEKWTKEKLAGDPGAALFTIYHGLSAVASKGRKLKRRKTSESLSQFLGRYGDDTSRASKIFGPVTVEYSISDPSKRSNPVKSAADLIKSFSKEGKLSDLSQIRLRAVITAFPKLTTGMNEQAIVKNIMDADGSNNKQWLKITGQRRGGYWKIRPVVLPLINWYVLHHFNESLKGQLK